MSLLMFKVPLICKSLVKYFGGFPSSSIGGLILDKSVSDPNLAGIVVYAPVINGELLNFIYLFMNI